MEKRKLQITCKYCPDIWEERSEEPSIQISKEAPNFCCTLLIQVLFVDIWQKQLGPCFCVFLSYLRFISASLHFWCTDKSLCVLTIFEEKQTRWDPEIHVAPCSNWNLSSVRISCSTIKKGSFSAFFKEHKCVNMGLCKINSLSSSVMYEGEEGECYNNWKSVGCNTFQSNLLL